MSEYIVKDDMDLLGQWIPKLQKIVRCRDCIHYLNGWCVEPDGNGGNKSWKVEPDGFCSEGERGSHEREV